MSTRSKPKPIAEIKNYITKDILKPLFDKISKEIKGISEDIEEYATQDYVGFKYRGRLVALLWPHRKSFDIATANIDENRRTSEFDNFRIEEGTEDYTETIEKIKKSFENLEGKAK